MSSRRIIRWATALLLITLIGGLAVVASLRVRQNRPSTAESSANQVLGMAGNEALGVYNQFQILERVDGKLIFALEALRTLGRSSGWHDIETVSVQLYNDDESKGPLLTCRQASFNVDSKNANLSGSVQVEFPDGSFLSTEVGAMLDGGRRFETSTNVVFVGDGILGSAGAADYDMKRALLTLSKGVVVRTENGDSLVAPELIFRREIQKLSLPQGGKISFGRFALQSPSVEVVLEEGSNQPNKVKFEGGVDIQGHDPGSGQDFQAWSEILAAQRDPSGRWQIKAESDGPWVRFLTVGGNDVVFQELLAWGVKAVAGPEGLLNVRADGRTCIRTIPLEGPVRAAESDSVRVWFDQGSATDLELINDVFLLSGDGVEAVAHRARLDAESGRVMLYGNPTGAQRVVVTSDRGRMTADQAVLFRETGRAEIRGRVQGEMFEAQLVGLGENEHDDQPVHIAAGILNVTEKATVFELRDGARMWQGNQLLTADEILYWSTVRKMEANGHVKTTLPATAIEEDALVDQDIVLSSRSMVYEDIERRAVFVGDVSYADPVHRLQAGRLEIQLGEESDVEKIVATGAVSIKDLATGQTLTGSQAIRDVKTGTVVMTGDPAKAEDEDGNMLSGRSLTWDQPSGRVSVSEETETIYHTEEEF